MSDKATETKAAVAPKQEAPAKAETPAVDHLALIKQKADTVGVAYTAEDTVDSIRAKINAKLNDAPKEEPEVVASAGSPAPKTKQELRQEAILDATRLIRVRITNMDPRKADLPGEFFTVSNGVVGTIQRFIPYSEQEDGWHVENMLLEMLKEKQFYQLRPRKGPNGTVLPDGRWVKEFAIEVLEPLTQEELRVLANKQAAAAGQAV